MDSEFILRKSAFGGFNKNDVIACITSLRAEQERLREQAQKSSAEALSLSEQLEQEKKRGEQLKAQAQALNEALRQEHERALQEMRSEHKRELEELSAEHERQMKIAADSSSSVRQEVGSAMIDVRRYADLLLKETTDRIGAMSDSADAAAESALARVVDISSGIQAFSEKLNSILGDILKENQAICSELTSFKGSLRLPFDSAVKGLALGAQEAEND